MLFEKGNQAAKKLVTDEEKRAAYKEYCEYVASGKPRKAWRWRHPGKTITWNTIEKYIREEPDVFDPIYKEMAAADSLDHWFSDLSDSAKGINPKANVASLQIILRNMHAWDARDHKDENTDNNFVQAQEMVMKQLSDMQNSTGEASQCSE